MLMHTARLLTVYYRFIFPVNNNIVTAQNNSRVQKGQPVNTSNAKNKNVSHAKVSPQNLTKAAKKNHGRESTSALNTQPAPDSQTAEILCELCAKDVDRPFASHLILKHPGFNIHILQHFNRLDRLALQFLLIVRLCSFSVS